MLTAGTILQRRYRVVGLLGQGGMGTVYEALDYRLSRAVALKETLVTEDELKRAFEREARLLANLHHPSFPRVTDHFNEGERQFLVMDFIPGPDLKNLLGQRGDPFPYLTCCAGPATCSTPWSIFTGTNRPLFTGTLSPPT